jgi:1-deoxy-D-xylulose-5-phosphate synthase
LARATPPLAGGGARNGLRARPVGQKRKIVAVIGDGSMTGGLAYEALNNIGMNKVDMIVVFNDNEMSISENVWSIHRAFNI